MRVLTFVFVIKSFVNARIMSGTGCPEGEFCETFLCLILTFNPFLTGYILWPEDSTCHRPFYQGPCDLGQILVSKPQVRLSIHSQSRVYFKIPFVFLGPIV